MVPRGICGDHRIFKIREMKIEIYFDGAILRNGQPNAKSGIGVVVKIDGKTTHEISEVVEATTNNQCEWEGLLCALDLAVRGRKKYPDANICLYGDSQMVVNQVNDLWQHNKFKSYYNRSVNMVYAPNSIEWIPREENEEADALSGMAIGLTRRITSDKKIEKLVKGFVECYNLCQRLMGSYPDAISIEDLEKLDEWSGIINECANEPTGLDKLMEILKERHNSRS